MTRRIHGIAGLSLAVALAAGCGSGGPGTGGNGVPPGPSPGQSEGFGTREENPGRGFDQAPDHAESPGGNVETPGTPGGPGPGGGGGGGGGGEDLVGLCMKICQRGASKCGAGAVGGSCHETCGPIAQIPKCRTEIRAAFECAMKAEIVCGNDGIEIKGCDAEDEAVDSCLAITPAPGGEAGGSIDGDEDWELDGW